MRRKKSYLKICRIIFIFMCILWIPNNVYAAMGNMYALVTTGASLTKNDGIEMVNVLNKNKAYDNVSVYSFTYDTEAVGITAGTKKKSYNNAIDIAYKNCTAKDTAFFFHSGHGMEGLTEGMGLILKSVGGQAVSWYSYDKLLKKLCTVKCKHMVIVIHACESGAVYKAYNKLPQNDKNKISIELNRCAMACQGCGAVSF